MLVTSVHSSSTYDKLHGALLHPGEQGMAWHRQFTPGAAYTNKDAATPRPLCRACVEGSMRQASTDHLRIHRAPAHSFGTQFALDAYSHSHKSLRGYKYADIFTDLTTGRMYPVFTKDRSAPELSLRTSDAARVAVELARNTPAWPS